MEKKDLWVILLTAFFIFTGLPAMAGNKGPYRLDDVVVSTSRSEVAVADSPQSVTVIPEQEIMASPFERVEDILRFSAGIQNISHYGWQTGGIGSHLSMRGTGRNRMLMMLDGVPLNDNFNNSIAWVAWGLIPREAIARIEIVRGPTSASYGSEGLGGVINIITKNPVQKSETSVKGLTGSGNTHGASALYAQKGERFGLLASGAYEKSDGFYMVDPEGIEEYTLKRHRDVGKGFGKVTYAPDPRTNISFSGLYYQHEMGKGRQFFYDDLVLDQYRLGFNHRGENLDWKGMLYLNRGDKTAFQDSAADGYTTLNRKEKFPGNNVWGGEIQTTDRGLTNTLFTVGMAYKHASMDYEEDYQAVVRESGASGRQEFISPFMDMTIRLLDNRLIANTGIRYDSVRNYDGRSWDTSPPGIDAYNLTYASTTWDNISPKAGLVYHLDNLSTVKTSIGSGFRAPSLFELYKVHVRGGGTSLRWANPDLGPEKIITWEAGGERMFLNNVWARITYYQSRASDYIGSRTLASYEQGGRTYTESRLDNISKVEIHGVETEIRCPFGNGLTSFLNYTWNISEITRDEENRELEGKYLTGDPKHKFRAGLTYINPRFINASLVFKHDRDQYTDSENTIKAPNYSTLDFSIWKKMFNLATVRLNIENLTNEKEYIEEGTLYYASVQFDF